MLAGAQVFSSLKWASSSWGVLHYSLLGNSAWSSIPETNPRPWMQASKRQPHGPDVTWAPTREGPSFPSHPCPSLPLCAAQGSLRRRVSRWMEVVAGCYEQVLFGFAVHPEPEADGHHEVRARARRFRRWWGGGASGLVHSTSGTHCLLF